MFLVIVITRKRQIFNLFLWSQATYAGLYIMAPFSVHPGTRGIPGGIFQGEYSLFLSECSLFLFERSLFLSEGVGTSHLRWIVHHSAVLRSPGDEEHSRGNVPYFCLNVPCFCLNVPCFCLRVWEQATYAGLSITAPFSVPPRTGGIPGGMFPVFVGMFPVFV
jgi:hypothetical protein